MDRFSDDEFSAPKGRAHVHIGLTLLISSLCQISCLCEAILRIRLSKGRPGGHQVALVNRNKSDAASEVKNAH